MKWPIARFPADPAPPGQRRPPTATSSPWLIAVALALALGYTPPIQAQPDCAEPPPAMIGWWPGESNPGDVLDFHPLVPSGTVAYVPAVVGNGFHLTGSPLRAAGSFDLSSPNAVTFETWFKFDSHVSYSGIISAEGCCSYRLLLNPNRRLLYDPGTHHDTEAGPILEPGRFYHVALAIAGGSTARLYLDGTLVSESANGVPATLPNATAFLVGAGESTSAHVLEDGVIDEPAVYARALSAEEILAIYLSSTAGKCRAPCYQRTLSAPNLTEVAGREVAVPIRLVGTGTENALSFSVSFDPALLTYRDTLGGTATAGAALFVNTNQLAAGRLGYALALPFGQRFAPGANELLRLRFLLHDTVGAAIIGFADSPVALEVADEAAEVLCCTYRSGTLTISPLFPPAIVKHPQSQTVQPITAVPTNILLSVTVTGSPPFSYQWRRAAADLDGAINPTLILTNVTVADSGLYVVVVRNAGGAATSQVAIVTVLPAWTPPAIATQPIDRVASAGETVTFGVDATGTEPLAYQWRFNATPLAGQTQRTLVLSNVAPAHNGLYSVVVTDGAGAITSRNASLDVSPTPRQLRFADQSVATAGEIDLPVELLALGDENAVGFSLAFEPACLEFVRATLGAGAAGGSLLCNASETADGRVGVAVIRGQGERFGAGSAVVALVRLRALQVSGPTPVRFIQHPTTVEVADVWGNPRPVTTTDGVVNVLSTGPTITGHPVDATIPIFGNAQFGVTATGSQPLTYQWQFNDTNLSGQTQPILSLPDLRPSQSGHYRVIVANAVAAATSQVATLTVPRVVRILSTNAPTGNPVDLPIQLLAGGDENALGFSLRFDPAQLAFREVVAPALSSNTTLYINTNSVASGTLGLALANPYGTTFPLGTQELATVRFLVGAAPGNIPVEFADQPALRELVDNATRPLSVDYLPGSVAAQRVAPVVTLVPASREVLQGTSVSFAVAATGSLPIACQWQRNGRDLPGQTNTTLTLPNVLLADAGDYVARLENAAGVTYSPAALLTVRPPPADLEVAEIVLPAEIVAGHPASLTWSVGNTGTQPAAAPWQNTVLIANNPQGTGARALGNFISPTSLATNQWLRQTGIVIVPTDLAGPRYFGVTVDSGFDVPESNEANNTTFTPLPTLVAVPDLAAATVDLYDLAGVPVTTATLGDSLRIAYAVANTGTATALGPWTDRIYLGIDPHTLVGATALAAVGAPATTLPPTTQYSNSVTITLPAAGALAPGNFFIIVATDSASTVPESIEDNNLAAAAIALTLPPQPDLVAANLSAPETLLPGQSVPVVWAVTNIGRAPLEHATWSETVAVSNSLDGLQLLARFDFTNRIETGQGLWRTQTVTLPATLAAGLSWFVVNLDSQAEVPESNESNNATLSTAGSSTPALLALHLPATQATEGAGPIRATLTRNGPRTQPLTVTLTSSDPTELAFSPTASANPTATLLIPAGAILASFDLWPQIDAVVDGPQPATVTAAAAGYPSATQTLTVLDRDIPRLALAFDTNRVVEGTVVTVTVSRGAASPSPLAVTLTSASPAQLSAPAATTIPAGAASCQFAVLAADDTLVEPPIACELSAAAAGFDSAYATLTVLDNDAPALQLTLAAQTVSEGAGPQATVATVSRSFASSRPLGVELVSSDPTAARVPERVTIPADHAEISFPVAAIDDTAVDGPQTAVLTPFLLASGSNVRLEQGTPDTLTVTDDDGPTLRLEIARDLVPEGRDPASSVTVTRNTSPTGPLTVSLLSDNPNEAAVPPTVVIPAGASSTEFSFASIEDGVTDGSQTVTLTASAPGFTAGADTVVVTDTDLPDLLVSRMETPPTAETESYVNLTYRVANEGLGLARSNFLTRVCLSRDPVVGDDTLLAQYYFEANLPVDRYFEQTLSLRMPLAAGAYWFVVETDAERLVPETLEDNNTRIAAAPVTILAAYEARVQTDIAQALAGTPIPLTGYATTPTGLAAPFKLVNIHILVRGTRRVVSALTDAAGHFTTVWQPLPTEAGFYEIFAAHPGVTEAAVQDNFTLLGLEATPATAALTVLEQSIHTGTVRIDNLSDVPLSGLALEVAAHPAGMAVSADLGGLTALPGLGSLLLSYRLTPATADAHGVVHLRVHSAEGASTDITFDVTVEPLRPRLVATPGTLIAGMTRGRQTIVEFDLANFGGIESGPVTISTPGVQWLSVASANPLPSIPAGHTNRVTLLLTPAADLTLGAYNGSLALDTPNTSLSLPFNFRALSEAKGDLRVTAVDELTFYAEGSPKVAGARVTVNDATTRTLVASGVTDSAGEFHLSQIPEAYYDLEVSADKHTTYRGTHLVLAGQTNLFQAFVSYQTVQYTWTVVPIEIEDRYQITIETTFETVVPLPVVTIEPALIDLAEIDADLTQLEVKITNHGLVAANNTHLGFPTHPCWRFEPLLDRIGLLPAKSSLTVPLTIHKLPCAATRGATATAAASGSARLADTTGDLGPCDLAAYVCWELICGEWSNTYCGTISMPNARAGCGNPATPPTGGACCGGPGGGAYVSYPAYGSPISCDPCLLKASLDCLIGFVPVVGDAYGWAQCILSADEKGIWNEETAESCLGNFLPTPVACAWGFLRCKCKGPIATVPACIRDLARNAFGGGAGLASLDGGGTVSGPLEYFAALCYPTLELYQLILDDPEGLWLYSEAHDAANPWLDAFRTHTHASSPEGVLLSNAEQDDLRARPLPPDVTPADVNRIIERWNRTFLNWRAGIFEPSQAPPGANTNFIARSAMLSVGTRLEQAQTAARLAGYDTPEEGLAATVREANELPAESGVCAKVKLRTEQEAVITRDAFRATLEIDNSGAIRLERVRVTLAVSDENGKDATGLFAIHPPELSNLTAVDGTGILPAESSGTARWVIVPSVDAAPTATRTFYVSGQFQYDLGGTLVSVPLTGVAITVLPCPRLTLQYFHQRDVYGDDPFTEPVEPSIPFSLAVMAHNRGHGSAHDFRITSAQPQIVENQKGLLVDFQIVATEVAGRNLVPSLTANFGAIDPGTIVIGRWLMSSTLQGLFLDYRATFEHLDGLGNIKLSLIDQVSIHEMIHLVQAPGPFEDGKPDFLVNDVPDFRDLPDSLYLSNGTTNPVQVLEQATHDGPPTQNRLVVQMSAPMTPGWTYLRIPEPSAGSYRLVEVRRSDGAVLALDTNVWVTDRTFIGLGRRPTPEYLLHLLDFDSPGLYTLTYQTPPTPDPIAPSSQVASLPPESYQRIPVNWSGQDQPGGSGIAAYDVLVSTDNGPFLPWLERSTLNGSLFLGDLGRTYAFYSLAIDRAGNRESAPGTPDASTAVTKTNRPPAIVDPGDQALDEGAEFALLVAATDPDQPNDVLTFRLAEAPAGMTIAPATGLMRWRTSEANGPATYRISLAVHDNGDPVLGATNSFNLTVREVNSPPTLAPIPDRAINEGQWLFITNVATDFDLPPNSLLFTLGPDAPHGATVDPATGLFRWRPTETQGPSTNRITLAVSDNGVPSLGATRQFTVVVRDTRGDFTLAIGSTNLFLGASGALPLRLAAGVPLTALTFVLETDSNRLADFALTALAPEIGSTTRQTAGPNRWRFTVTARPNAVIEGAIELARLAFATITPNTSASIRLRLDSIAGTRDTGQSLGNVPPTYGRIIVVGQQPVLEASRAPNNRFALTLFGRPGASYRIDSTPVLALSPAWTPLRQIHLDTPAATIADLVPAAPMTLYRAVEIESSGDRLAVAFANGAVTIDWPLDCTGCVLEESPRLEPPAWTASPLQPQIEDGRYRVHIAPATNQKYYRLRH